MNNITIKSKNLNTIFKYQNYFSRKNLPTLVSQLDDIYSLLVTNLPSTLFTTFTQQFSLTQQQERLALAA